MSTHLKLGRKAIKTDSRTLKLARYMETFAAPPASVDWSKGIKQFGMMLNDQLGCCTISGVGHAIQVLTANASSEVTVPDSTILAYYESWDGYDPNDPDSDSGGIELDVLNKWKKQGFSGHKLLAFADPQVNNLTEIKQAINLFGGLYIGFNVPQSVMNTSDDPTIPWDIDNDTTIVGGHAVYAVGYDATYVYAVSWGQIYRMTWSFWRRFVDEAHAILAQDFIETNGLDPQGFDLVALQADLAAIK